MAVLYLIEQNTILRKTSERLTLCRMRSHADKAEGVTVRDTLLELPCADVEQVMLFGNVQVTTQAMQQLLRHGIELAIFTKGGRLLGQLTPPKPKNIELRLAQFERYHEADFVLNISKQIVRAKLTNCLELVRRHHKNYPEHIDKTEINELVATIARIGRVRSGKTLLGVEGAATGRYFKLFSRMIRPPWQFKKRTRRPPRDPVNAVLSFGYVIVGAELQSILDGIGFDPYLGFFHAVHYGRPSLALDLLEEFRQPVVDRLALRLFNLNMLKESDFLTTGQGAVYLNNSGKRKFFEQYEALMGEYVSAADQEERSKSFRVVLQQRAHALARCVRENIAYEPFYL